MISDNQSGSQRDDAHHLAIIVEDDPTIAMDVAFTLRQAGFARTRIERRFAAALAALDAASAQGGARLVVLDVGLRPDQDGTVLAIEIRNRFGPRVSIIFLTGYDDAATRARAERSGPLAYLTKPHDADALLELARRALAGHRAA